MAPNGFLEVPDWFSWDNQGCGLAVTELGGGPALLVLTVDASPELNRAAYRVGTGLDPTTGQVTGWSPWRDVPDWLSWDNQGAGLAVGDISGTGRPDLVVLRVDAPAGQNSGWYRVGFDLADDGAVTGGWSAWHAVPDWFSWENQGADLALGDITGSGRPDLVVFMVDDVPNGQNRGVLRVGRDLDQAGVASSWSPEWVDAPQWFSWTNQGGGVALAQSQTPGRSDIVVFGIDSPPGPTPAPSATPSGQNQAFYQVARAVNADGQPTAGWSSLLGVNNWFSWDNQYGALAVAGTGADPRLLVAAVDNPPGQNALVYRPVPLSETPPVHGRWHVLPFLSGVLAIHAAVLHTGKVLFFAGTGNNQVRDAFPAFGDVAQNLWTSVVWDPTNPNGGFTHPATIRRDNGRPFDFFCGGDTFLPDGRVFSAGGNLAYNNGNNLGQRETAAFDPTTEQWTRRATMHVGRWYPSLITLQDGRVLTVSGKNDTNGDLNRIFEIYDGATDHFQPLVDPQIAFPGLPFYAHLFLLADGKVFFSGGRMDDDRPQPAGILDLRNPPVPVGFQPIASQVTPTFRNQSASVLLPPAQAQNVMLIGGGPVDDVTSATGYTERIDLRANAPVMTLAMPLSLPRMHLNAVLLPDRTVFVSGGAIHHERQEGDVARMPRLQAEIYEPDTDTWRPAATASVIRMYHSVALLLPDATVVTACGNPPPYGNKVPWIEQDNEELKLEVYEPPYLFRGPRPVINAAPTEWTYGATVTITTTDTARVLWAELVRPGITTHSFDNAQRIVDLPIATRSATGLSVTAPAASTLAPPGWYMLFLVDTDHVPSEAAWVHLT